MDLQEADCLQHSDCGDRAQVGFPPLPAAIRQSKLGKILKQDGWLDMAASDRKGRIAKLLLVYVSGIAFIGTSAVGILGALQSSWQASQKSETAGLVSADLLKQIQGYRNVIDREPNNRFALEQLVQLELQLGRKSTAQEYLDRLLKLDPQNSAYQSLQQQLAQK